MPSGGLSVSALPLHVMIHWEEDTAERSAAHLRVTGGEEEKQEGGGGGGRGKVSQRAVSQMRHTAVQERSKEEKRGKRKMKYLQHQCHPWRFCSLWSTKRRMRRKSGGCGWPQGGLSYEMKWMRAKTWSRGEQRLSPPCRQAPQDPGVALPRHPAPPGPLVHSRCACEDVSDCACCGGGARAPLHDAASPCSPAGWNVYSCC